MWTARLHVPSGMETGATRTDPCEEIVAVGDCRMPKTMPAPRAVRHYRAALDRFQERSLSGFRVTQI